MVTSGMSVRSSSGSRGCAAACVAADSTSGGNPTASFIWRWIAAMPCASVVSAPV